MTDAERAQQDKTNTMTRWISFINDEIARVNEAPSELKVSALFGLFQAMQYAGICGEPLFDSATRGIPVKEKDALRAVLVEQLAPLVKVFADAIEGRESTAPATVGG